MVAARENCLNCAHLLDFREESGVDGLASGVVASLSMDGLGVDEHHVLLQSSVHEGNAVCPVHVIEGDRFALLPKPLNRVSADAVVAAHAHAVVAASGEHPHSESYIITRFAGNFQVVGERMEHLFLLPLRLVVLRHIIVGLLR